MSFVAVSLQVQTNPGTAVPFSSSQVFASSWIIQADPDNNADCYVGDSAITAGTGLRLKPGETLSSPDASIQGLWDLSDLWAEADDPGAGSDPILRVLYSR